MSKIFSLVFALISSVALGQINKRSLNQYDYDGWKTVQQNVISNTGKWISYEVNPQLGDGILIIKPIDLSKEITIQRGYSASFTPDGAYLIARIKPSLESTRQAKKKKLKPEDMPKDSLVIVKLADGTRRTFANVKSYEIPKLQGSWVGFISNPKEIPAKTDSTTKSKTDKSKKQKPKGDLLTLLNVQNNEEVKFKHVTEFQISEKGNAVVFVQDALSDTSKVRGVFTFLVKDQSTFLLDTSSVLKQYKNAVIDPAGQQVVWMQSADSLKAEVKRFALVLRNLSAKSKNEVIVSDQSSKLQHGYVVSEFRKPSFSEHGERLYFGSAPLASKSLKDTLLLDEEMSRVDVWGWEDTRLQPMQLKRLKDDKEKSSVTLYLIGQKKLVQSVSADINYQIDTKANHAHMLGTNNEPYQLINSWDLGHADVYLLNVNTGEQKLIAKDLQGRAQLSPTGKYVVWFDQVSATWVSYETKSGKISPLTKDLGVAFQDEDHDSPSLASPYGSMGWSEDDKYFMVYDRYDVWQLDPLMKERPALLTNGYGRKNKIRLRYAKLDQEAHFISQNETVLLSAFWEESKEAGYLQLPKRTVQDPVLLVKSKDMYAASTLTKAKDANQILFQKGNYKQANELYVSDVTFKNMQVVTAVSAQMDSIKWGDVELVSWIGNQGAKLEGLLYKPEGFDLNKKYPMLVYFYERNSDLLHQHRVPSPSRSTINIPYCVSNDYLVFVPDIIYSEGLPGKNAYDCIVPGVIDLIKKGFVDEKNIGLQGQSWGGYQTAYLITQTNMFKAGMAGAPVVNMTSAYGGIRWGTGMSRMFQYEKTQSRIGGTLWEKPTYYIENSPLFYADRVETPLLMMHNDADGSVPWYQGIEYFTALRRLKKPVWLLVYNDEDHNLMKRPNMKDLGIRMYQFFDFYLKGAPQPAWMKEGRSAQEKEQWNMKY